MTQAMVAYCIGCGCHDYAACAHEDTGQPCHWLVVDRVERRGVCSCCQEKVAAWHRGQRDVPVPIDTNDLDWQ